VIRRDRSVVSRPLCRWQFRALLDDFRPIPHDPTLVSFRDPSPWMVEMAKPDRFEQDRLKKLDRIVELGHDPYGQRFDGHIPIGEARGHCPDGEGENGPKVRVAGRVMLRRKAGKLWFFDIKDATGKIQLLFSRGDLAEEQVELMRQIDLGDLIGIDGKLKRTQTGEISIFVQKLTILCKSLTQPPEKFHGAKDVEMLLRQRYLDLIYNDGVLERMLDRSRIIDSVRQTLRGEGFHEVETPVLHAIAGGAAARPFITQHNTLEMELYLRIALELHLKRLMVGGVERVYEIGRVFRNEGIDTTHNPEFTMIEIYQAYGNYESMMDLTEAIVCDAVRTVSDSMSLPWGDGAIDFTAPWPRRKYADLFREHAGCEMSDTEAVKARAKELASHGTIAAEFIERMDKEAMHPDVIVNEVFEATVENHLHGPIFVIDYPASICPLTKRKQTDPAVAERFELYVQGMELANAYTELNDPRLQQELFETQLAGLSEEESMAKMDLDFIRALKVGMPPAGGLGIGIDRLVMLLTNSQSIRDVIYFPLLRPEGGGLRSE
jgi:lysyl-tRNA synthetase, class II